MEPVYIVIDLQSTINQQGTLSTAITPFSFRNRNAAEAKYHDCLRLAAAGTLPKHAVTLITEEGFQLKSECYTHEVEE